MVYFLYHYGIRIRPSQECCEQAQALWDDPALIEFRARTEDEPRFLVIGCIGMTHWSGVITYRENRVRVISVRRARQEEIAIYES